MLQRFKNDFKQRPKTFLAIFAVLLALVIILLVVFRDSFAVAWPNRARIQKEKITLQQLQENCQDELNKGNKLVENQISFIKHSRDFWLSKRDGSAEVEAQKKVKDAAAAAGLQLTSVGQVRSETVAEGVIKLNLNIMAKASMQEITDFLAELQKIKPCFYWKSLSLRPDNIRNPKAVNLSGNVEFIGITDENTIKKLLGEK